MAAETGSNALRNVALLGHGGSGKTTLADAMCYISGAVSRRGSVTEGTAHTDFTPEEKEHGMSIELALARLPWMDARINLLDTPGYQDFWGEVHAGARVADGAVIVVDAASGVDIGTERGWELCDEHGLPRLVFVTGMDRDNASFEESFEQIDSALDGGAIPVEVPIGAGSEYRGIVNLFSERAHLYRADSDTGEYDEGEIPDELEEGVREYHRELIETIATTDDDLLEAYLEGEDLPREQVLDALSAAMARGELFPVFCGSGESGWGVRALMKKMVELLPSPVDTAPHLAEGPGGDFVELGGTDDDPLAALAFKATSEAHAGELSFLRVFSGCLENGETVYNQERQASERMTHLSVVDGEERTEVARLHAGDIGVAARLKDTRTGDTLCRRETPVVLEGIEWPEPDISVAVRPASRTQEDKLATGLSALHETDPTFRSEYDAELGQTIARGLGELHLQVCLERLERKFGVDVITEQPRVPYRETITRRAEGKARHKKQSGGRGQFGDCSVRMAPRPRGSGYEFVDSIKGGAIPSKFIPAVDQGIQEAAEDGILAGYPVIDFQVELFDGSHHSVDSSEQAFRIAGSKAFKKVAKDAHPVLLEPVMDLEVKTPEEYMGDVIGDLNGRRGRVLGIDTDGHFQIVRAQVPQAQLYRYSAALRSLTHGAGAHTRSFHAYEQVPHDVAQQIIDQREERREAS